MRFNLLEKRFTPDNFEKTWYTFWENNKLFAANETAKGDPFSIVFPPPNITGKLHMGHALNVTLQDILCRYERLRGKNVLWVPGTDHAGIATQNVVEKEIMKNNINKEDLGRDNFIKLTWEWKKKYGDIITDQMKKIGASCDWNLRRFTMDKGVSIAVRKVFVNLYENGLIYKGNYITNWCTRCGTALSDIEVEYKEIEGHLYKIKYPYHNNSGNLVIATTRPETMLGDTAIAVNPKDSRYTKIKNKKVILPIVGRIIPVITSEYVDPNFGTGILKITPAHDPNDFEIGKKHKLPIFKVINSNGKMNHNAGSLENLDRYQCREKIISILKKKELLVDIESYRHNVGHCYRCKTIIEYNLSEQWFVKVKPLANKAIKAVKKKNTRIFPSLWTKTYYNWMENIKDWCISRQIWWGHRIPAWTCNKCKKLIVTIEAPNKCPECMHKKLTQDTDVLDTWFSSSLWPFSAMGWPENNNLLKIYYPTSVLVTGFDILFFWVARMMMMGIYFMNIVPFKNVYVHALVRDETGKKMSKSQGNVINPLKIMEKYGADAFRYSLASFTIQGRDIKMSEKRVNGYRNFINKLWNVARFSLFHIKKGYVKIYKNNLMLVDFWILLKFNDLIKKVSFYIEKYEFSNAANCLYNFVWHEFCDWYIEAAKPALYGKLGRKRKVSVCSLLWHILKDLLILLNPFIPFVTEEIWHKLPGVNHSIMEAKYPTPYKYIKESTVNESVKNDMSTIVQIVSHIRSIRGEMNISESTKLNVIFQTNDNKNLKLMKKNKKLIIGLAKLRNFIIDQSKVKPPYSTTEFIQDNTIHVILKGIINLSKEKMRLTKKIKKISLEMTVINEKLNNKIFLTKAPKTIISNVKKKYNILLEKYNKINNTLKRITHANKI